MTTATSDEKFDLKLLLQIRSLNVKAVSQNNEQLTVQQYFDNVELFLQKASVFASNLQDMNSIKNERFFLNSLDSYKAILPDIEDLFFQALDEFKELSVDIGAEDITDLIVDLNEQLRSGYSNSLCDKISKLSYDITMLYNKIMPLHKNIPVQKEDVSFNQVTLIKALEDLELIEKNRRLRVLIVDDLSVVLNSITAILKPYYDVFALTKGEQALKFLEKNTPDLFLLDIEMPGMNGYEVFSAIRKLEVHKDTPIIFLTGNATSEYIKTAISIGAADFIKKPVDQKTLLEKIERNIVRKKLF